MTEAVEASRITTNWMQSKNLQFYPSIYCSPIYESVLLEGGIVISMSRPGMPYDNALMESFFSILKNEDLRLINHLIFSQMHDFIDSFMCYFNEDRPQWNLKKLTPFEFRSQLV